ncbi:MAG: FtsK/SpoIIIE domain-containing protein [Oscillospiraceae bacterium]|nr:FtsK/SpoIIIE domain-containing protein [Oscillospiraceae bacterium]
MSFLKTLWHSAKGLCRKPHTIRKIGIFMAVVLISFALAHVLAGRIEAMIPALCVRWLWILPALLYLVTRHGEIITRRRHEKFFARKKLMGFDGKRPLYIKSVRLNHYLKKIRFKSRVPIGEWEKTKPHFEMFYRKKIYKIENLMEDITVTDIYVIEEKLPKYIEWQDEYMVEGRSFAIGEGYMGQAIWNAADLAHGIVAGATGGGKTALLRCIIRQAIHKKFNVLVLDFKQGGDFVQSEREYRKHRDLEAGYGPVISEPEKAREVLTALLVEVWGRLERFKEAGVTNIDEFKARRHGQFVPWLLVIDEAAEILDVKPKDKAAKELYTELDQTLRTLARISRAAGVHILLGVIRPSHDVIDGQIKNNLLWRACAYFADSAASGVVLGNDLATTLPPNVKGRFIIGEDEVQAYYLPLPKEYTDD